jgi:hypothetical protein
MGLVRRSGRLGRRWSSRRLVERHGHFGRCQGKRLRRALLLVSCDITKLLLHCNVPISPPPMAGDGGEAARANAASRAIRRKKLHFMLRARVRNGVGRFWVRE